MFRLLRNFKPIKLNLIKLSSKKLIYSYNNNYIALFSNQIINESINEINSENNIIIDENIKNSIKNNNVSSLINLFTKYENEKLFVEGDKLFNEIEKNIKNIHIDIYEHAIKLYCLSGNVDKAISIVKNMIDKEIIIPNTIYHYILHTLCFYQEYDRLEDIFYTIDKKYALKDGRIQTPMMRAYREQRCWKDAWNLYNEIIKLNYYVSAAAYVHLLVTLQENEQYEKSIESFQYQRKYIKAVNNLHFSMYLTALSRLKESKKVIDECKNAFINNQEWLSLGALQPLSSACHILNDYTDGVKICKFIHSTKEIVLSDDSYYGAVLSIYTNGGYRNEAKQLVDNVILSKTNIEICKGKTLRYLLLYLIDESPENMIQTFQKIINVKYNIPPVVLNPFLLELINRERYEDIRNIYLVIRSAIFTPHDASLHYFVRALCHLKDKRLINEIYSYHNHTTVPLLLNELALSYKILGDNELSLKLYQKYFILSNSIKYQSNSLKNAIELCIILDKQDALKNILETYINKTSGDYDKQSIENAIKAYETTFNDTKMKRFLQSLIQ